MEFHYVISWSSDKGWYIDWEQTMGKYHGQTVYIPAVELWTMPVPDSEVWDMDENLIKELDKALSKLNNKE